MNAAQLLPLANLEDLVKVWAPIIFFVLYGIAQLVGSIQEEKRKAARKRLPPAPDAANNPAAPVAPAAGNKPATLEETLRREVDEFLRRAQGQAAPAKKAPQPKPKQVEAPPPRTLVAPAERRTVAPSRAGERRPEPRPQSSAKPTAPAADSARPSMTPTLSSRPSISERVQQDLGGAAAVAQHAGTLGADVAQADERMEQHLREKFAHQLGTFVHAEHGDAKPAARTKLAVDIRKLLSTPEGAKQVIIASEVLQRPTHRW